MEEGRFEVSREGEEPIRVRVPRENEVLGEIIELLGASRFRVKCYDGKLRLCRIPGKFRKRIKISVGDVVLVEPWSVESDEKGDIVWIYTQTHVNWLKNKGYIKTDS